MLHPLISSYILKLSQIKCYCNMTCVGGQSTDIASYFKYSVLSWLRKAVRQQTLRNYYAVYKLFMLSILPHIEFLDNIT